MPTIKNNITSEKELNEILDSLSKELKESKEQNLNLYDLYIHKRKAEESDKKDVSGKPYQGIERHHIIPKFDGGTDDPDNLVLLTVKEHVIAHWLRWQILGKIGDKISFLFRVGDTEEALAERLKLVQEAREKDKLENKGFYNSEFQREMGLRGGAKGGSANSDKQFLARQKVGQSYGRVTGIQNQSSAVKSFVLNGSIWAFSQKAKAQGRVKDRGPLRPSAFGELFCLITSKESFSDVARTLNTFVPNSIPMDQVTSMHKLVKGERPQMYGWRIVEMLIRSEVRAGIENFYIQNPNQILLFEEDFAINENFE
jgi:hypothetical protein